jgi:hypothetical protein
LFINAAVSTVFNFTGSATNSFGVKSMRITGCNFELNSATSFVLIYIAANTYNGYFGMYFTNCWVTGCDKMVYLVKDLESGSRPTGSSGLWNELLFNHVQFRDTTAYKIYSSTDSAGTKVYFDGCNFPVSTTFTHSGVGSYMAQFRNCININPYGYIAQPFSGVNSDWLKLGIWSTYSKSASPTASKNATVSEVPVLVTSSGGTGVSISVYDVAGNAVLSGNTTLQGYYLPIGWKVNFGAFSVAPLVVVSGL